MIDSNNLIRDIRQNLKYPLPGLPAQLRMAPSFRGELLKTNNGNNSRKSAVLISLFPENGKLNTLLIKRTTYDGVHSGQVSFPGGKFDEVDESLIQTALREAYEEVGINPSDVEILGTLTPLFIPVSNMEVQPVIGLLNTKPELQLNSHEVEFTITVPICHLKNPANHLVKDIIVKGYSIEAPYIKVDCEDVWGATAMIISEFIELYSC
ncbi:MAG: CoA pyrophosphatase [Bacteroidales bacterium]|nr:CoA pyrophosphatase [Bacteroidales bacterium]